MGSALLASLDDIYETKCYPIPFQAWKNIELDTEERNTNLHLYPSRDALLKVNMMLEV